MSILYANGQQNDDILRIDNPYKVPPTPEASAILKYGEYPVSYNTGVPDISVPLYIINSGELTLPINLSYYAGGIKVDEVANSVGLGWTLNGGGVINRTVMGIPDRGNFEFPPADSIRNQGYQHAGGGYEHSMWTLLNQSVFPRNGSNTLDEPDKERDIYNYYFDKNGGSFFLADWKVSQYPYTDNKIINLSDNIHIPDSSGFKIITPDGTSYSFQAVERSTIHSITASLYSEHTGAGGVTDRYSTSSRDPYTVITAWYLTRIESADGNSYIDFEYMDGEMAVDYTVSDMYSYSNDIILSSIPVPYNHTRGLTTSIRESETPLLKRISFSEGEVLFDYENDRTDRRTYRLGMLSIRNNAGEVIKKMKFNNDHYFHSKRLKLESVQFLDEADQVYDSYSFDYYESMEMPDYASLINGIPSEGWGYYQQDLCGYYNGASNNMSLLPYLPENTFTTISLDPANRNFSFQHARTYTLKKIKYVTGGETEFIYDAHEGEVPRSPALRIKEIKSSDGNNEGRTLKKTKYTYSGVYTPMEEYGGYITFKSTSYERSLILDVSQTHHPPITLDLKPRTSYHKRYSSSPSNIGAMNLYQYRYGKVEENIADINDQAKQLKTVYEFDNTPVLSEYSVQNNARLMGGLSLYGIDFLFPNTGEFQHEWIASNGHFEYIGFNQSQMYEDNGHPYFINLNWTNPTLKRKSIYSFDGQYTLLEETENQYEYFKRNDKLRRGTFVKGLLPNFVNGSASDGTTSINDNVYYRANFFIDDFYFYDIYVSTGWKKLVSTTTRKFEENAEASLTKTTSYEYGAILDLDAPHAFLTQKTEDYYTAGSTTYHYEYPRDFKGQAIYDEMLNRHQISPVIKKVKSDFDYTITQRVEYGETESGIKPVTQILSATKGVDTLNREIRILSYDTAGNPIHLLLNNGMSVVCIWENHRLIAEIKNIELSEVSLMIGGISITERNRYLSGSGVSESTMAYLRTNLTKAYMTSFAYEPLIGIIKITGPDGITTKYNYDKAGRLETVADWENNLLQRFEYKYRTE